MPPSWTDGPSARRRNDRTRRMYTNKKTIANSPYEEALSELRAAVPSLQAIADRAFALATANEFEGRAATSSAPVAGILHLGVVYETTGHIIETICHSEFQSEG